MDRTLIWPDFRDAWILHEDDDLLVVDKPCGVASQAADPERPDDVVTRLKRALLPHGRGATPYLGVHQRLDRDTSGVLVYARRREANAALARQFEGRSVDKTYVSCVEGWPAQKKRSTLRDALAEDRDGAMRVVPPGTRGARDAVTHVRVLSRTGGRTMLELSLETGRTHQARVQLAHAGAPIAGDVLYGGPPAGRLMLHAAAVGLEHPGSGARVRFEAPLPVEFEEWMARGDPGEAAYDDASTLRRLLGRALELRWGLGRADHGPRATNAFRLLNEEGDGAPRLAVDVYDAWLVAQFYGDGGAWGPGGRRDRALDALAALGFDGVYLKVRPKQANVIVDSRREDLAPRQPVRGTAAPDRITILEEGIPYIVRLGDGLSTGIFLDQRDNRRRLRAMAAGARVANLFAYTCAFSLAAALGGATATVSVDISAAALERGQANFANAGVADMRPHGFVAMDAFGWLERARRRGERYDMVVVDPPSYSTTKGGGRFVADRDFVRLAAAAMQVLSPGGRVLACTNHRGISRGRFRKILFEAGRSARRDVAQVKDLSPPSDFPVRSAADEHTKSALVTLER
jgi:23S rRNA (cytosine1962-C5)-methyltransferase